MKRYHDLRSVGKSIYNEYNDCAVISFANVTGIYYSEAYEIAESYGRKHRRAMNNNKLRRMYLDYGLVSEPWTSFLNKTGGKRSLKTIGQAFPKGNYIVLVRGHASSMIDGEIDDWAYGTKKVVKEVWRF